MPYTIKLDDAAEDVLALREAIRRYRGLARKAPERSAEMFQRLEEIADAIEEQVKPAIEEPTEFGSVVRAGIDGISDRVLWLRGVGHYWFSETARRSDFGDLHNPEVLRVGIGDDPRPVLDDAYTTGVKNPIARGISVLLAFHGQALTAERKDAYQNAINVLRELS